MAHPFGVDEEQVELDWDMVAAQLPANWRELAVKYGVVPAGKPHHSAKITDPSQLLRLLLFRAANDASLAVTCAMASAAGLVEISMPSLHDRERRCAPYLAALLRAMVNSEARFASERWAGYRVMTVDATSVMSPGASETTARVHYAISLADLRVAQQYVTSQRGGETFRRFAVKPGELWMGDRGYANPPGIAAVVEGGATVLVRYTFGALPLFDAGGQPIDVEAKLSHLGKPGRVHEWTVFVQPKTGQPIRGRLVAVRLPPAKAEEARKRLHRELGKHATPTALRTADFVVVFTTIPRSVMSAERVLELYRLRWQVELNIKRDKSITGMAKLPNFREDTICSWLYAKLLAQQIARRLSTPRVAFPPSAIGHAALSAPGPHGA